MTDLNDKEMEIFGLRHKEDVIGLTLFDNPLLPQDVYKRQDKKRQPCMQLRLRRSNIKCFAG